MASCNEPVYYSDGIDPVFRSRPDELFLITIEAKPTPDSEDDGELGGAFVNCWVNVNDLRAAERRAVARIQERGWQPHRFEEWELVTRETYADEEPDEGAPDLREVVEHAFAEGESYVWNTWPADAPDADEE